MRISIEVMKNSVQVERAEGEVSPKVRAVLVRPNGTYTAAYRGELRDAGNWMRPTSGIRKICLRISTEKKQRGKRFMTILWR